MAVDPGLVSEILTQQKLEQVVPKMEAFRDPMRIKLARSGRGTGKSWGGQSIAVQQASFQSLKIAEFREIQKSIQESSHQLICDTIKRLRYPGWRINSEHIRNENTGSIFIFKGLKDLRAANQVKSFEGFDRFILEEASAISMMSLSILLPTLRKPGSELWAFYNPTEDPDPITERLWDSRRDDVLRVELMPGKVDNPYWTDELQKEMEEDYARDPDEAEHIWGGQPRKQGQNAVMSRVLVQQAMKRVIEAEGLTRIGVDVARYGDDKSVLTKTKGLKVIDQIKTKKQSTMKTAYTAWDFADKDPSVIINVDDTGVGGGVTDRLEELGAQVNAVLFGENSDYPDKYSNMISQLWFEFPLEEADIPDDKDLKKQLSGRLYTYDSKGRKKIESKDDYKKRYQTSPDEADSLLLSFYTPNKAKIAVFDAY